ncbi:MAG TPA: Rieske 2Fe-2S domain-containing protein [Chloroflexota bacterium]
MVSPDSSSPRTYTAADYTDFAHTGPGTLAGRFMRTFWQPVARAQDIPPGHAKPLRIMSEDFTLFRGEDGTPHVVAPRCAHRGTQLSTGWVEGDCIRCVYHGWKYDGSGQCVEMPAEDPSYPPKVRIASYPTEEYLGLVFAYLGEGTPPPLSRYPELEEEGAEGVSTRILPYNYFNGVENSVDIVHVSFVHSESGFAEHGVAGIPEPGAEETEYGILMADKYPNGQVRVTLFEMPTQIHLKVFPHDGSGKWRTLLSWKVPIDDASYHSFVLNAPDPSPGDREDIALGQAILAGQHRLRVDDIGPRAKRINLQDFVAQAGQGVIADRAHERLGRSDKAVILLRRIWERELRALAAGRPLKPWRWPGHVAVTTGV